MREFTDAEGTRWTAIATDRIVAHGRQGAVLAFRPADQEDAEAIPSTITFNSLDAAEFALTTLGEKELRRRLSIARSAAGQA